MTTLAEDYLRGSGGSITDYHHGLRLAQRNGQAFFNALSGEDQQKLAGTLFDPFHKYDPHAIEQAIDYLLGTHNLPISEEKE